MPEHRHTTGAAAYFLGVGAGCLRKLARAGRIPYETDSLGKMTFAPRDVERLKISLQREKDNGNNRRK